MTIDYSLTPLPAKLQHLINTHHLSEREAAAQLEISRHEYRKRLNQAIKIIGNHSRCLVGNGEGI
jgi:predicted DNA-binding protein (UPF0251 family)